MKNNILSFTFLFVAFISGVLSTYLYMTKQQMDQILQSKQMTTAPLVQNDANPISSNNSQISLENLNNQVRVKGSSDIANTNELNVTSINNYSERQALDIVNQMPDYVLGQYVDKFMAKGSSDVIADKRRFAERAVEELYNSNDNQPLVGNVKLSLSPTMASTSLDTSTLDKNAKLYAHLDTAGKVPSSPFVFVKWVNNQTGQVLLFEKKDIVANRNQNWVSFIPYEGWAVGSYDIRFYQFTSELQPIAQLTYNIYSVIE